MFDHILSHTHGSRSWNRSVHITDEMRIFNDAVIGVVFVAGLVLNLTALGVFYWQCSSWTDTHIYMVNPSLADSGLVVISPVRLYESFLIRTSREHTNSQTLPRTHKHTPPSWQDHSRSVGIVTANLRVLALGFTPIHVALLLKSLVASTEPLDCQKYILVYNIYQVTEPVAPTKCCLDAVGQYFLAGDFSKELVPMRKNETETPDTSV